MYGLPCSSGIQVVQIFKMSVAFRICSLGKKKETKEEAIPS